MSKEKYTEFSEKICKFSSLSQIGIDFCRSYLITFARELEYKNKPFIRDHELCKFCNNLYHILEKEKALINDFLNNKELMQHKLFHSGLELNFKNIKIILDTLIYFDFKLKENNSDFTYYDRKISSYKEIYERGITCLVENIT